VCWPLAQAQLSAEEAAPLSAVPAEASGTFNPLHKVLCILQSIYLCSVGPMPDVLTCGRYTPHFKLQSQAALLLDPSRHITEISHTACVWDSNPVLWIIPYLFLCADLQKTCHLVLDPQHLLRNLESRSGFNLFGPVGG